MNEEEKKAIEYFKDLDISFNTLLRIDLNGFRNAIQLVLNLIEKQQKEIERLKEEAIGDTKFDKLLFSIRMLHFHNYVNDKQFAEMIKKLSNENKGEINK